MKPTERVPLEKQEQAAIIRLFEAVGTIVCRLSQSRASRQTEGLPDLYCFHPGKRVAWWWETKRQKGGRLSPLQQAFRDLHETPFQAAVPYALSGALPDAEHWLTCSALGLAARVNGQLLIKPKMSEALYTWRRLQLEQRAKARRRR